MKSTRRWFYLTGSLTVLVLALMGVLWAMSVAAAPPGATELTNGDVKTDVAVIGPSLEAAADRDVKVTLTNTALSEVKYVGTGPNNEVTDFNLNDDDDKDDDDVIVVTIGAGGVNDGDRFRVNLRTGERIGNDDQYSRTDVTDDQVVDPALTWDDLLPITDRNGDGEVTIADVEIVDLGDDDDQIGSRDVRLVEVLNAGDGLLRFEARENLGNGNLFGLRFATSPQETALVNVRGDGGSFDLLTVENVAGPSGEYTSTFVADDEILIAMHSSVPGSLPSIMHEQHDIPAGLRGNVVIDDERLRLDRSYEGGDRIEIKVKNPPIRLEDPTSGTIEAVPAGPNNRNIDIDTRGVSIVGGEITAADAATGTLMLEVADGVSFDTGDEIEVSYRGSDSFEITLNYRPDTDDDIVAGDFVVPSNTDMGADFGAYFAIVGQDDDDPRKVTIGVSFGGGDDDEDYSKALPGHLTVLGVSYDGVERIMVPRPIAATGTTMADGGTTGDFIATLDFNPQDANDDDLVDGTDIRIISSNNNGIQAGTGTNAIFTKVDGNSLTINPDVDLGTDDYIDIAYAVDVGMNPRNALMPGSTEVADRPVIRVGKGSRVTITSDDDRTTVDAEGDAPTFDNASPASGSATMDLKQVLSIEITDALAGVDTETIRFLVNDSDAEPTDNRRTFGNPEDKSERITLTTQGDVVTASVGLDDLEKATGLTIDDDGETDIYWFVKASDKADNEGISDAKPDKKDDSTSEGNQGFMLRVDNAAPKMTGAFTGEQWDPNKNADDDDAKGSVVGDRRLRVEQYLPGSSNAKIVRAEFNEGLDGGSVDASDFQVMDGSTELAIAAARWFNKNNDDGRDGAPVVKNSVFIELEEALAAGDTPSVKLTGTVTDAAGNELSNVTIDSDDVVDGIAPTAMVSLDTMASKQKVAVTVRTDENIRTLEPTLKLYTSTSADAETATHQDSGISAPRSSRTPGENEWTYNLSISDANRYSVVVEVEDSARNHGTTGKMDWTDSGSISFEIDNALRVNDDLTTLPVNDEEKATQADPFFVEINWLSEAGEYTGDSHKSVMLTKAVLDAGKDNERDLIDFTSTRDGQRWTVAISDIGLGKHVLTYNAEDDLGNTREDDQTLTFTVVARPVFNLDLTPGLNLVSLPGDPTNKDINAVFGGHAAVDLVYTRSGELWRVAQRSAETGMFEPTGGVSDLTTIDAQHAYFVRATASARVGIDISYRGALQVPPSIQVKGNQWNLVPVISLLPLEKIPMGSALDADTYLGTENWTRGFTFDRGRWMGVVPNKDAVHQCGNADAETRSVPDPSDDAADDATITEDNEGACGTQDPGNAGTYFTRDVAGQTDDVVEIGRGYWVWFTKDGTITP